MLRKLYKQEVLNVVSCCFESMIRLYSTIFQVSKYERARAEINGELLRRFQQRG